MEIISSLRGLIDIPKDIISKSEKLLKVLFGESLKETGFFISDHIKYYRFKNQTEIFCKASGLLEKNKINAKPISLKYLVPLIDLSSLEEDEKIQSKWANMIANLASYNSEALFNKNCIELLNKLSPEEIYLLDDMYRTFNAKCGEAVEVRNDILQLKEDFNIYSNDVLFDPFELANEVKIPEYMMKLYIENLVSFGLLQFEELDIDSNELIKSYNVYLTYLGLYFIRLCRYY
ncbi:Abi-alpha family protein [Pseudozobellia sp. WGM2]|uniref:Abi-alpha family protein n=1 Tax=Pseudozobellia sp. WGM2 TaxID=2787625 RepID=UPI001ADFE8FB|nr:Abi-alpha family protein [Pseudozobellia sp. WGM2]